jgi:CheY-like chemotaxis protein
MPGYQRVLTQAVSWQVSSDMLGLELPFPSWTFAARFSTRPLLALLLIPLSDVMETKMAKDYAQESGHTILLVEDFDDTRLMMKLWLAKRGYNVIEAPSGAEAIRLAREKLPDLIIMDMMMPGMNGLDATHQIREHQALRQTPIVAVSAYGADEYRTIAIEAGCNEYVSTPFEPSSLAELIKSLLAARQSSKLDAPPTDFQN